MRTSTGEQAHAVPLERRRNQILRERFDTALAVLRPILNQGAELQGAHYFKAFSRLHDTFPDMTQGEMEALLVSVLRKLNQR